MSEPEPFYLPRDPDRGLYHATYSTTGPWFADAQHAGPPSALLVRALEQWPQPDPEVPLSPVRVTMEVLGPIPAGDVEVRAEVLRPGRRIELLQAQMLAGGRPVLSARGWRFAAADTADVVVGTAPAIAGPDDAVVQQTRPAGWLPGFMDMIEWRWLGGALDVPGPGRAWVRQRVPLVAGEEPTPLQRLVVAADSANGIAAPLDLRSWLFVNTELSLHLHRAPVGEWTGVDAATVIGPTGMGTVSAVLYDAAGHTGRATQALTVRPR